MRALLPFLLLVLLGADPTPGSRTATPAQSGGTVSGSVRAVKNGKVVARKELYVYLKPLGAHDAKPGAGIKRQIVQKELQFAPRVVVVPVGAVVAFPNGDRDKHNVYSPTEPSFDLGTYGPTPKGKERTFEDEDEVDIYCDVHRFMSAKVKVVDSPYIAKVVDGKFTFSGVKPGKYRVYAWGPNSPDVPYPKEITVTAGQTIQLDRELHLQIKTPPLCHDRKDGSEYDKNDYGKCPPDFE
jgi:plastocyanin